MILSIGRACIVKKGRDFGKLCMVISEPKDGFVDVEGPQLNKRKINVFHIWPLKDVLSVKDAKHLDKKVTL